ncbi:MAG: hypothetical protein K6A38_04485 [Lachnospiraceae bacterium]|nr:hypothetical protein [Lachnospiraceae bacterium]
MKTEVMIGTRVVFVAVHMAVISVLFVLVIIKTINTVKLSSGPSPWWEDSEYAYYYDYEEYFNNNLNESVKGAEFDFENEELEVDYDKHRMEEIRQEK